MAPLPDSPSATHGAPTQAAVRWIATSVRTLALRLCGWVDRVPHRVLAVALVAHAAVFLVYATNLVDVGDAPRYFEIASTPGRLYVDYPVERAFGEAVPFKIIASQCGYAMGCFTFVLLLANVIGDAVVLGALAWGWGLRSSAMCAVILLPLMDLVLGRVDIWSTAAAVVGAAAWRRRRPVLAGTSIAVGASFKIWPLLLVPMLLASESRQRRTTAIAALVATGSVIFAAWFATAGWNGMYQVVTFRGATGWQIEGTVGAVLDFLRWGSVREEAGAWRIGSMPPGVALMLFVVAAPLCAWTAWTGARHGRIGTAWLASVATLLLFSPLFSAQFMIWLAPGGALAYIEGDRRSAALTVAAVLLTWAFWSHYGAVMHMMPIGTALVVARNVVLIAMVIDAIPVLERTVTGRCAN